MLTVAQLDQKIAEKEAELAKVCDRIDANQGHQPQNRQQFESLLGYIAALGHVRYALKHPDYDL
jgi:hypothetical protein